MIENHPNQAPNRSNPKTTGETHLRPFALPYRSTSAAIISRARNAKIKSLWMWNVIIPLIEYVICERMQAKLLYEYITI